MCFDLYSRLWKTNGAEMHGRHGQPQAGVDVFGTDNYEGGRFTGVQCKGKDQDYGGALSEDELRAEIKKAETFVPPLNVFVIATTAPNDVKIQKIARTISKQRTEKGLFEVRVQGWDTLQRLITNHREVLTLHFPDFAPLDILEQLKSGFSISENQGEQVLTLLAHIKGRITAIAPERVDASDPLQARIMDASKLTDAGSAHVALVMLQRIEQEQAGKISARNLYRLRSGFGFAHLALGDLPSAIRDFRDAHAADPDWPNAHAILAIAELLAGDGASAFEHAKKALTLDPASYHAAAVILDTAPKETTLDELEGLIPPGLHDRVEVQIGFALRARKMGEIARAEEYAKRAVDLGPEDLRAISALAEALLEPIITIEGLALTRRIPAVVKARFDEAHELLQRSWEKLKVRDDVARHDHIVANLINTLDVAGRDAEAEQVLEQALKLAPRSGPLLHRYAQKMAKEGDWQAVLTAIQSIPSSILEPQDDLIRVHGLLRTGNAETALTEARALQNKYSEGRFREAAAALRLEAAVELGSLQTEFATTLGDLPKSIVLRSVAMNLLKDDDPRRNVLVGEIETLIAEIDNPADRFHAAEALYNAKQFARAAELYAGLHGTDTDTLGLRRHLVALHLADNRLEARTLFESLSDEIKALPAYAEMGAAIYERAGLLNGCREIIERYLLKPTDLEWRVQWISICQRTGDTKAIIEWLSGVQPDQDGPPRDLMLLAQAINHYTGDLKCLPIAYRALRSAYTDPQIHLGYMAGLFLFGRVGGGQINTPEQVAPNTAVLLVEKGGDGRLTRVIETEPNPQIERDEIAPTDSLAVRLIGLRVGDEIELDTVGVEPARYVVSEIRNKYLHAHFRSLERFPIMFPENRAFGSIKIDEGKGDERFKPLFDAVKRRGEFAHQVKNLYREGRVPLAVAANIGGTTGFEFWEAVRGDPEMQLHVTLGGPNDYQQAHAILSKNRRAVVDPITLYGLVRLGIAEIVRASFDDLGVVQTTIDLLRRFVQERERGKDNKQGRLGWDGEHYQMIEFGPDAVDHLISQAQTVLSFAESLTRIPAEAPGAIPDEAKQLFEELDPAYLDTILAVRGDGRILLCDDASFRQIAAATAPIEGIWTQPAVAFAIDAGKLTLDNHFRVGNALTEASYFFTTINCGNFLHALTESGWTLNPTLMALIESLARPTNMPQGVDVVLRDLIWASWAQIHDTDAFGALFTAVFAAFDKTRPHNDVDALTDRAFAEAERLIRRKLFPAAFQHGLRGSTFHTPVGPIAEEARGVPNRTVGRFARALSDALHDARNREAQTASTSANEGAGEQ